MGAQLVWSLALLVAWRATAAEEEAKVRIPVQHQSKRELMEWAHQDMLKDYREGDTLVLACYVAEGYLWHYGHRGRLLYASDKAGLKVGTLVRGRFTVKVVGGEKKVALLELLESKDTSESLDRAERDYRVLLPEIRRVTALKGSHLELKESPPRDLMMVVCPPEGWRTLYVLIRQYDLMYECDVALKYGFTGKDYMLIECWAAQWFKGE